MTNIEAQADFSCHNATPCDDVRAIRAFVRRKTVELEIAFRLDGNISRIRLTGQGGPHGLGELWRHTCFEAFIRIDGHAAYHEFNFAPSREWRVYAFRAYRDAGPLANEWRSTTVAVNVTAERLELDTRILLTDLSSIHAHSPLRLGLAAVIESHDGSLSYWAHHHPAGKPDFHHADAFALRLVPPSF